MASPVADPAVQLQLLVKLIGTKPQALRSLKARLGSGSPLKVKGFSFSLEVMRAAVEQAESGADLPTIHSSSASSSTGAAAAGPPPAEVQAYDELALELGPGPAAPAVVPPAVPSPPPEAAAVDDADAPEPQPEVGSTTFQLQPGSRIRRSILFASDWSACTTSAN